MQFVLEAKKAIGVKKDKLNDQKCLFTRELQVVKMHIKLINLVAQSRQAEEKRSEK